MMGTTIQKTLGLLYWVAVCLLAPAVHAAESSAIPGAQVEDLLTLAQQQNPELAGLRLEAGAAAERVSSAGALPDPAFRIALQDFSNINSGAGPRLLPGQVGSAYYRVMQSLPFWGKRALKRDIAEAEANQANGAADTSWAALAAGIKIYFAQYYTLGFSRKLTREMLELSVNLERIAKSRYATGLAPQQDVIRAQLEQTALRANLVMLESEYHHSMTRLNSFVLRAPDAVLAEPRRLRPLPASAKLGYSLLAERLRQHNPEIFAAAAQLAAADKNRDLVFKNRYPDFALGVATMQVGDEIKSWELMLELNIPLQQGARRAQEREAEKMLAAAEARKEAVASRLLGELAENVSALESARQVEILTAKSLLPQAEATLQAAYVGYQNGKVDFATLLDAQRQILKARLEVLNAQLQAQTSLALIEKLLGETL